MISCWRSTAARRRARRSRGIARARRSAETRAPLEEIRPQPTESEQVAEGWWDATSQALREVVEEVGADRVAGVCITHQRESYAPVDEDNASLRNAILWDDGRAGASSRSSASSSATTSCTAARAAARR